MKLIKSSHNVWSLILGPGPERAYCSLLCPLQTVTGGLPGEALISDCLSFSIKGVLSGPRMDRETTNPQWMIPWPWDNQLCMVWQTSGCEQTDCGVCHMSHPWHCQNPFGTHLQLYLPNASIWLHLKRQLRWLLFISMWLSKPVAPTLFYVGHHNNIFTHTLYSTVKWQEFGTQTPPMSDLFRHSTMQHYTYCKCFEPFDAWLESYIHTKQIFIKFVTSLKRSH